MPPKKGAAAANKKAIDKQKQKIIEDKTFGLKNKNKSSKVQAYVNQVKKTVETGAQKKKAAISGEMPKKSKAELEKEKKDELNDLLKITQKTVPKGVDPKSVLCEYFKQGQCTRGDKCRYSHDLNIGRKTEKIDIYTDRRLLNEDEKKADDANSANWSQEKLEHVSEEREKKAGRRIHSEIICKHFLEAIETRRYGWFWICPNGGDLCQYRHCLPPGYQLKSDKKEEEKIDDTPLEEIIEEERKLLTNRTPVTLERFLQWKKDRLAKKEKEKVEAEKKRQFELKSGTTQMSGRALFEFKPELFVDDDAAAEADEYELAEEDVQETVLIATGTSITAVVKNKGAGVAKPAEEEEAAADEDIDESLFAEEDIEDVELPEDDE